MAKITGEVTGLVNHMMDILHKLIEIGHPFELHEKTMSYGKEGIFGYKGQNYFVPEIDITDKDICALLPDNHSIQIEWYGGWFYRLLKYHDDGIISEIIDWTACVERKIPCFDILLKLYILKQNVDKQD